MADLTHDDLRNSHLSQILATLRLWRRRIEERAELARLGEREMHDLGMSPAARQQELRKPFWKS